METVEELKNKQVKVLFSERFFKHAKKYAMERKSIDDAITAFKINPFAPHLKTHKLSGAMASYWSFSVNYHLRILFRFIDNNEVLFLALGTHEIYK